jgi:hypothetical protein
MAASWQCSARAYVNYGDRSFPLGRRAWVPPPPFDQQIERPVQKRQKDFLFAMDVVIQAGLLQANRLGNILHGRGMIALLAENDRRSFEDLITIHGYPHAHPTDRSVD